MTGLARKGYPLAAGSAEHRLDGAAYTVALWRWTFDLGARLVLDAAGTSLHLTPKAFDLLAILIERAPDVVRKADLHARLWPDSFVSDATLAGLIKELRRAFRDKDGSASGRRTVSATPSSRYWTIPHWLGPIAG